MASRKFTAKEARSIGSSIGVDFQKFSLDEFRKGLSAELEHKDVTRGNLSITGKIAMAHLREMPDYYTKLDLMERGACCPCSPLHKKLQRIENRESSTPRKATVSHVAPASVAKVARRALEWRREFKRGGTDVGVRRAVQLANRQGLSDDTVRRMKAYFARHAVDKKAKGFREGEKGFPSAGRVAWDLWGGDPGRAWLRGI